MAVSPMVLHYGSAEPKATASKAKALAVRTNSIAFDQSKPLSAHEAGPELAEQLNEDTKQKYVKG